MKRKSILFFYNNNCPIIDIMIIIEYQKEEGLLYISLPLEVFTGFESGAILSTVLDKLSSDQLFEYF